MRNKGGRGIKSGRREPVTFHTAFTQQKGPGWLEEAEARMIWEASEKAHTILEIGECRSKLSGLFAARLGHNPAAHFFRVNLHPYHYLDEEDEEAAIQAVENAMKAADYEKGRYSIHAMTEETLFEIGENPRLKKLGLLYLRSDTTYEGTKQALGRWAPRTKKGLTILCDGWVNGKDEGAVKQACLDSDLKLYKLEGRLAWLENLKTKKRKKSA